MRPGRNDNASGKAGEVGANQNIQPAQDTTAPGVTQATIREATGYPVAVAATQRTPRKPRTLLYHHPLELQGRIRSDKTAKPCGILHQAKLEADRRRRMEKFSLPIPR